MLHDLGPQTSLCSHTQSYTQTSKAARLCGAPVCPRHTEKDRGSLSFARRLKQQERVTWSETQRESERESGKRERVKRQKYEALPSNVIIHILIEIVDILIVFQYNSCKEKTIA